MLIAMTLKSIAPGSKLCAKRIILLGTLLPLSDSVGNAEIDRFVLSHTFLDFGYEFLLNGISPLAWLDLSRGSFHHEQIDSLSSLVESDPGGLLKR